MSIVGGSYMEKWYEKKSSIVSALALIPPLGIVLMYRFAKWTITAKVAITVACSVWLVFWAPIIFFGFPIIDILITLIYVLLVFLFNPRSTQLKDKNVKNNDSPYFDTESQKLHVPARYDGYELAYHYENVNIAGAKYYNKTFDESLLGKEITFLPDIDNEYDKNAIKIMCSGVMLGYVHKGTIQSMILDWSKCGDPIFSVVSQINAENKEIKYFIAFYKSIDVSKIIDFCEAEQQCDFEDNDDNEDNL